MLSKVSLARTGYCLMLLFLLDNLLPFAVFVVHFSVTTLLLPTWYIHKFTHSKWYTIITFHKSHDMCKHTHGIFSDLATPSPWVERLWLPRLHDIQLTSSNFYRDFYHLNHIKLLCFSTAQMLRSNIHGIQVANRLPVRSYEQHILTEWQGNGERTPCGPFRWFLATSTCVCRFWRQ